MLISDRKKFIFIHIPKTGGMTVRMRMAKYDDRNKFYFGPAYNPDEQNTWTAFQRILLRDSAASGRQ